MSRTISIDVKLVSDEKISARSIIETLINSGWYPIINDSINYLPINDNEMYNWTKEKISVDQLLEITDLKENKQEIIGVDMYWKNSNVGITVLIFNPDEISFSLNINSKYIDKSINLIDFNWYTTRILPSLCKVYNVIKYKLEFIY